MPNDILESLLQRGELTAEQVDQVRRRMKRAAIPAYTAILDLGFSSQEAVFRTLAEATGLPFVILGQEKIAPEATAKVPPKVALHYSFVPLSLERGVLRAAFAAPPSLRDRESLRLLLGLRLDPVLATPADVSAALKKAYGLGAEQVLQLRRDRRTALGTETDAALGQDTEVETLDAAANTQDASIINLVNEIIAEAIRMHATDVHIEPFRKKIRLRYRIDGMLREIPTPPGMAELQDAIISRLKIMARLNIAEKRLPHDGRIRLVLGGQPSDIRVSIIPTRFGETICLRILASSAIFIDMTRLGLSEYQFALLTRLVSMPHGIILVTGPTGSGKTTTLYAALAFVRDKYPERKIITVENPVEYELEGTTQIQMHAEIGLTFATALRAILRHDPDIILVGEIRDNETAEIAIQSALTGHLVLSTLHTNDSVGAVNRLVNMGIEPYLVASALVAVLAQRLVRRICPHCREEDTDFSPHVRAEIAAATGVQPADVKAWRGRGCLECDGTGYHGRVAIYEFFLLDDETQEMVAEHASTSELRKKAAERGMKNLRQDGWAKVASSLTSIEEVQRITSNFQISYNLDELD